MDEQAVASVPVVRTEGVEARVVGGDVREPDPTLAHAAAQYVRQLRALRAWPGLGWAAQPRKNTSRQRDAHTVIQHYV